MSSANAIDTSQYTSAISNLYSTESLVAAVDRAAYEEAQAQSAAEIEQDTPKVDLNNYYTNVHYDGMNADVGTNLTKAAQDLDNAVVNAVKNGMSLEDAVKIQTAKAAYSANANVAKSTFELEIV